MSATLFPDHAPTELIPLYLDLMKRCLLNHIHGDHEVGLRWGKPITLEQRIGGLHEWPSMAHTMVGLRRLENVQHCAETVLREQIPGDFLEAGVWRGGATILMRAVLQAYAVTDRYVWVADSFAGVPPSNVEKYPYDQPLAFLAAERQLAIPMEQVQANFARYGLLDDQVKFLKGWFRDTLPTAPVQQLALLRLDGDLYESNMDGLVHLYPKLAPGGFVILDDYKSIPACRKAVDDYRHAHGIIEPLQDIDRAGAFWRRSS